MILPRLSKGRTEKVNLEALDRSPRTHSFLSVGPVIDLSRSSQLEECLSQSLQSLTRVSSTPVAAVAPLTTQTSHSHGNLTNNNPLSLPTTPHRVHSIDIAESETTSLPDENRLRSDLHAPQMINYDPTQGLRYVHYKN